jgi:hypothetical protein
MAFNLKAASRDKTDKEDQERLKRSIASAPRIESRTTKVVTA